MAKLVFDASMVLDEAVLEELENLGDPGLVAELNAVFESTAEETLEDLAGAAKAGDVPRYGEGIHKLKGSSGSMGAASLFNCCKEVDRLFKDQSLSASDLRPCLDLVEKEFARSRLAFRARLAAEQQAESLPLAGESARPAGSDLLV